MTSDLFVRYFALRQVVLVRLQVQYLPHEFIIDKDVKERNANFLLGSGQGSVFIYCFAIVWITSESVFCIFNFCLNVASFFGRIFARFFLERSPDCVSDVLRSESRQMTGDRFVWGERIILSGFCLSIIVG